MRRAGLASLPTTLLAVAIAAGLLAGCEPEQNTRPATAGQEPISVPVPLPEATPIMTSDLPPEDSAPLTGPSKAPLPAEGDVLTSGQVLDRLRARLSFPTCIVGPNNTRWRHKYAGYPQHFADEVQATLPMMLVVLDELETHHLPAEFAMIPIVESWYRPDTHSFGGAAGMWQLLAETARNNGATVDGSYDGRLSTLDATDAAMNYLGKLQGMFNDWRLAAMAYNSGEYRLAKTMSPDELAARGAGGVHYRRPGGLAWGTYEYVSKMRALDCMLAQPQRQGIPFDPSVPITHWIPYTMPADIDSLDELARRLGMDAEALKAFNLGYHNGRVAADAPRTLLVPASTRSRWMAAGTPALRIPPSTSTMMTAAPSMMSPATSTPAVSATPVAARPMPVPAPANVPISPARVPDAHAVMASPAAAPPPSTATTNTSSAAPVAQQPSIAQPTKAIAAPSGTAPATTPLAVPTTTSTTALSTTANGMPETHPLPSFVPPASAMPVMPMPAAAASPSPAAPKAVNGIAPAGTSASQAKPAAGTAVTASPPVASNAETPIPVSTTSTNTVAHEEHAPSSLEPTNSPTSSVPETTNATAATIPRAVTTTISVPSPATSAPLEQPLPSAHAAGTAPTPYPATPSTTIQPTPLATSAGGLTSDVHTPASPAHPAPVAPAPLAASSVHPAAAPPAASPPPATAVTPITSPPATASTPNTRPATATAAPSTTQPTTTTNPGAPPAPAMPRTYKVQLGDSLDTIARQFGVSAADLSTWNHLAPDTPLYVDQKLKLEP